MGKIELDGRELSYWEAGQGPALVFIHGVGTSGAIWRDDLAGLDEACRVVVYDRRGYGESSPSPRDWAAHTDDAIGLIEALDAAPAVLVGYSGGAIVALDLMLRRPELAAGLVLLDPAFQIKRCLTAGLVRTVATAKLLRRLRGERRGAGHWMRYVSGYSTGGSAFDRISAERRERLLANASAVFDDLASGAGEHIDEQRLRDIEGPITLVEAELSPPFLRRSCARLRGLLPQARTVSLEQSGHHIGFDARDELLELLREAVSPGATITS